MINTLSRALLSLTYLLALASVFLTLPMDAGPVVQKLAVALLAVHALECALAFKYVKTYSGSLTKSMVLSLLFGLLHWMPLARSARATAHASAEHKAP
ncbi:MAG: hypothetical protein ACKOWD_17995 [Rhodoferax sp.]